MSSHLQVDDGVRLSYRILGTGPTVVLLHALTVDSDQNWDQPGIAAALVDSGRQVVLVDARGHGESDLPADARSHGWERHGRDVVALLDHLRVERCVLVGYSMGACTAAWLAPRDARVSAAVLAGIGAQSIAEWPPEFVDAYVQGLQTQHAAVAGAEDARLAAMVATVRALAGPHEFRLGDIDVPVLVLNGVEDAPTAEIASSIPGACERTVPGNHGTAPLSPEFISALLEFLDRCD